MIPSTLALAVLGGTLLLSLLAVPPLRCLAWHMGLVDAPGDGLHKSHTRTTPYGGGIAIWSTTTVALILVFSLTVPTGIPRSILALLIGASLLFLTGLIDDWRSLPTLPRFLIQIAVTTGLLVTCPQFRLPLLSDQPLVSIPLTGLWIVALTNAFNFLDNMDGLSAGIAAVCLALLAAMALHLGHAPCALLCLALLGAVSGFLFYNFPPATVFMGDAGGFFLGFVISGVSALLSNQIGQSHADLGQRLAPLLVLTVPVYDLLGVSLIRLSNRIPPWVGDKNHISHRLVRLGLSRRASVLVIHAATLVTGLVALAAGWMPAGKAWVPLAFLPLGFLIVAPLDALARHRHPPA